MCVTTEEAVLSCYDSFLSGCSGNHTSDKKNKHFSSEFSHVALGVSKHDAGLSVNLPLVLPFNDF